MKVSIVTVCRNAGGTIVDCVSSVLAQQGVDIEYIVIDGLSTDDTLRRIDPFTNRIARIVSEKDAGIYDAMNKGLAFATGEVVGFLNADDAFASPDTLAVMVDALNAHGADIVFGDVEIFDGAGVLRRMYRGRTFRPWKMRAGFFPPHPSFYARTDLLRKAGGFDTQFKIAADMDLTMRVFKHFAPVWTYLPLTFVNMRAGGMSNQGFASYTTISRELVAACRKNGMVPNRVAIYGRAVRKSIEAADATTQRLFGHHGKGMRTRHAGC